jgi:ribosomal protein S18 acetylase RimI-like enzyme
MTVTVATPGPADASALAALKAETFTETYAADNDPAELAAHVARSFGADTVADELADPRCRTYWLVDGERPVGYVKLNVGDAQTVDGLADGLEVEQLYVRSGHQGQGLGALLLARAVMTARELGLAFVWLGVWERNQRAIDVYQHIGFRRFSEHTFVLGGEPQRDVLMRRDV